MCEEIFEIVKKLDLSKVEVRMALQCAPVILGIKNCNLLTISSDDEGLINDILQGTDMEYYRLCQLGTKSIFLLFRSEEFVYRDMLLEVQKRYSDYIKYGTDFPHEIGILLGYPKEDIVFYRTAKNDYRFKEIYVVRKSWQS